jgi:hypothetical protein
MVAEPDLQPVIRQFSSGFLGPFNGHRMPAVKIIRQAQLRQLSFGLDAIQVRMRQAQSAMVFMDQDERRAAHVARRGPETGGNSANQRGFPRSQLSEQCDDIALLQA